MIRAAAIVAAVLAVPALAHAELPGRVDPSQLRRVYLDPPPGEPTPPPQAVGTVSPIIYLERCVGGCTIYPSGTDDAKTYHSSIPNGQGTEFHIAEFEDSMGRTGTDADPEWNAFVKCVKEVYSPFAAVVTDVKPTQATSYHMNVVGNGKPQDVALPAGIGGISPGVNCTAADNHITYTFAGVYGGSAQRRTWELCWTASQETAHTYSLDHAYSFADGSSACNDPMTYREDCGGQKFFRNMQANCGEGSARPCKCGSTQNAHLTLLSTFGPGTPITSPPAVVTTLPAPNSQVSNGVAVVATASAQRGVASVELWLNGYKWKTVKGAPFGADGQPESSYSLPFPPDVPDGVIDIVVRAKDDIDVTTAAQTVTVTKGAPCTSADSCAKGQQCEAGKCFWEPAAGELGDDCTYAQFCLSGICSGTADKQICTQSCVPGVSDACPDMSYECVEESPGKGICFPKGEDQGTCLGCQSASSGAAPFAFAAFGLAFVLRKRRR